MPPFKIGFDFWQTVTQKPVVFHQLFRALDNRIIEVHIISAVPDENNKIKTSQQIDQVLGGFIDGEHILVSPDRSQYPQMKLEKAMELGLSLFVDDRLDTCELMQKHGILALNILRSNK